MSEPGIDYKIGLFRDLAEFEFAVGYLDAAVQDEDQRVFMLALKDVSEARGLVTLPSEGLAQAEVLWRELSLTDDPELSTVKTLLHSIGMRLAIQPYNAEYNAEDENDD